MANASCSKARHTERRNRRQKRARAGANTSPPGRGSLVEGTAVVGATGGGMGTVLRPEVCSITRSGSTANAIVSKRARGDDSRPHDSYHRLTLQPVLRFHLHAA